MIVNYSLNDQFWDQLNASIDAIGSGKLRCDCANKVKDGTSVKQIP